MPICHLPLNSEESISLDVYHDSFKNSKGGKLVGEIMNIDIGFHMHITNINRTCDYKISRTCANFLNI